MHCYICDTFLEDPKFDSDGKTLPCSHCQAEIDDAISGYGDDYVIDFDLDEDDPTA